jgi:hypothetical protein
MSILGTMAHSPYIDEEAVVVGPDDVLGYNEDNILPQHHDTILHIRTGFSPQTTTAETVNTRSTSPRTFQGLAVGSWIQIYIENGTTVTSMECSGRVVITYPKVFGNII